jgi:hypothetical protein
MASAAAVMEQVTFLPVAKRPKRDKAQAKWAHLFERIRSGDTAARLPLPAGSQIGRTLFREAKVYGLRIQTRKLDGFIYVWRKAEARREK